MNCLDESWANGPSRTALAPPVALMRRVALGVQYDGTAFSGWQSQPHGNTVQDRLEGALAKFARDRVMTVVAGRTDAGVHALGQVVHIDTPLTRTDFSWVRGVNTYLPPSITVRWARVMPDDFHARFAACERTYYYVLHMQPVRAPLLAGRVGWVPTALDVEAMRAAGGCLIGEHDYSAFRSSECQARTPVKRVSGIDIVARGAFVHFRFRANAFLHHMVRNMMGCLIAVGRGRQPVDWLARVLAERDRRLAAPTFMPDGLYLARVDYPAHFAVPPADVESFPWSETWR